MTTVTVTLENLDREDLRLLSAAIRDKRKQMLDSEERERTKAYSENRQPDTHLGNQSHRMASLQELFDRAYKVYPMAKGSFTFQPKEGDVTQ